MRFGEARYEDKCGLVHGIRAVVSVVLWNSKEAVVAEKIEKTDEEWREKLTSEQYQVTRRGGTERAFTGEYHDFKGKGIYLCVCCGNELFRSDTKYDSCTGWPSFWAPKDAANVETEIGFGLWHGAHGGKVQPVRRASRACVRRWTPTDRIAVLHELRGA